MTISDAGSILGDCHVGDSIAVNGACLTVTRFDAQQNGGWFEVWLANETLERTDLGTHRIDINRDTQCLTRYWVSGERKVGDQLNLERAMGPHVRFGGHFVQVGWIHSPVTGAHSPFFARVTLTILQRLSPARLTVTRCDSFSS